MFYIGVLIGIDIVVFEYCCEELVVIECGFCYYFKEGVFYWCVVI